MAAGTIAFAQQSNDNAAVEDWTCPMDTDYHARQPGTCPRCGMRLIQRLPGWREARLEVTPVDPLVPQRPSQLRLSICDAATGTRITQFEFVHEKLMHLFVVSENLDYFNHAHPELQADGTFTLSVQLPWGGMYRILADYYPKNSVPQLSLETIYVQGTAPASNLVPVLTPQKSENLSAELLLEPNPPLAAYLTSLTFTLNPIDEIERYLGSWAHMLIASADTIDLQHTHPVVYRGGLLNFRVVFPRPGLHRVWIQVKRRGQVNTLRFTVPVLSM